MHQIGILFRKRVQSTKIVKMRNLEHRKSAVPLQILMDAKGAILLRFLKIPFMKGQDAVHALGEIHIMGRNQRG